jgi:hypothetical protein
VVVKGRERGDPQSEIAGDAVHRLTVAGSQLGERLFEKCLVAKDDG